MSAVEAKCLYTSRIIKSGALVADARAFLAAWRLDEPLPVFLSRARSDNVLGKASQSRIDDVLLIFRQRYLDDLELALALRVLAVSHWSPSALTAVLYFFAAQSDRLLHDVATDVLASKLDGTEITSSEIEVQLEQWVREGKAAGTWSPETRKRIAQGVLATLRDFGLLRGARRSPRKQLAVPYLPVASFAFICLWLSRRETAGIRLVQSSEWRTFFLPISAVEHLLVEAQGERLLTYQAAGNIVRIEFPTTDLVEYAHVVAG